jgi:formiminoglutamase
MNWLNIQRGTAPLILSIPHAGTELPPPYENAFVSPWLARKDADWWLPELYGFAAALGATIISTAISRSVIDVNRDPSGSSLYPGQATTSLCPLTTFDGEPLYPDGEGPEIDEIRSRRARYFGPYHEAIEDEIARLKTQHESVILYDCHSIRSVIPRLFPGTLPNLNIGTNDGKSCSPDIAERVTKACQADPKFDCVVDGRFKGGWITRHHGRPEMGVHAIQMEIACRGYIREPEIPSPDNWPPAYDEIFAAPLQQRLKIIIESLLP